MLDITYFKPVNFQPFILIYNIINLSTSLPKNDFRYLYLCTNLNMACQILQRKNNMAVPILRIRMLYRKKI